MKSVPVVRLISKQRIFSLSNPYDREILALRFWKRVERGGDDDCWEWSGAKLANGVGVINIRRPINAQVTHVSWELYMGLPLPPTARVRQTCENRSCVNPRHLVADTPTMQALKPPETKSIPFDSSGKHAFSDAGHLARAQRFSRIAQYAIRRGHDGDAD